MLPLYIRQLSKFCEFGDILDMTLRDRLVCGIKPRSHTGETTVRSNLAQAIESADKDATGSQATSE